MVLTSDEFSSDEVISDDDAIFGESREACRKPDAINSADSMCDATEIETSCVEQKNQWGGRIGQIDFPTYLVL